jgi:glycosyltransferase involved in cell wall biosynthesis
MSTVSVIIPCYNYAHFLQECVQSVLSQTGVDVRVLIIDDASSDNTPAVAAELVAQNQCVEYRQHKTNMGHIATYNEGLAWASGDYTVLLSADDMLTPGALRRATQLMDAHPEVGFVYGWSVHFDTNQPLPKPRLPSGSSSWQIYNGLDWLEMVCMRGNAWIASPEVVVRTNLQHKLGGYRPELPHSGDHEMWMRFAVHASVGEILETDQAFYRIHRQSMSAHQFSMAYKDFQQKRAAFDSIFQNYSELIPDWERLRKMADRNLASDALWTVLKAIYRGEVSQTPVFELVKYAHSGYRNNFFDLEYLSVYTSLSSRILRLVRGKLASSFR